MRDNTLCLHDPSLHYTCSISPLHNNKTFFHIDDALYKLEKTKIAFENHLLIEVKLI